ncbi:MAG: hypothetical protein ACLP8S_09940 [Solirubrobacteraceae bacterium]
MDRARWARLRWRLRGAWLWPSFVVLIVVDAVVGHALPPAGDTQSLVGAWLVGMWAMLIGIIVLAPVAGLLIRRRRPDMPRLVARNYGGAVVIVVISASLLAAGLIHRPSLIAGREAAALADARARSWIGRHAPAVFRRTLRDLDTYAIQPGSLYRICAFSFEDARTYCVVVDTRVPVSRSVSFAGYEPNSVLSAGGN